MPRYATVLFDLDGTLLNTLEDLADSTNHALQTHGYPPHTQEEICRFVGNGVGQLIRRAMPTDADADACAAVLAAFKEHYAKHNADKTRPYDGIPAMLEALRAAGVKLAIVSNKNDENVKVLAAQYFGIETAIGERQGVRPKPAPDSVFAAMQTLHASAKNTLYVGDSEVDIETAANAGIACLAVTWGFRPEAELRARGATHFAHSPEDITAFVAGDE